MDEKALLAAIGQMMEAQDKRLGQMMEAQETRLGQKLNEMEQRIAKNTVILMDAEFKPQFSLLSDEIQLVHKKLDSLASPDDIEVLESRIDTLERVVKTVKRDLATLKEAK